MYCNKCNKEISDDSKFCNHCGCPIQKQDTNALLYTKIATENKTFQSSNSNVGTKKVSTLRCEKCQSIYPSDMSVCPSCKNKPLKNNEIQIKTGKNYADQKPKFSKGYVTGLITGISISLFGFLMYMLSVLNEDDEIIFHAVYLIIFGIVIVGIVLYNYIKKVDRYNLKKNNPEEYNKLLKSERERAEAERIARQRAEQNRLALLPECPICKSKVNVKKISNMDRSVSVAMVGLASSKIGKQYECTKCKHKW